MGECERWSKEYVVKGQGETTRNAKTSCPENSFKLRVRVNSLLALLPNYVILLFSETRIHSTLPFSFTLFP